MKTQHAALAAILTLGVALAACEKKPESKLEQLEDKVKDGLDARPNEKLKDAGENAAEAVKDAGEAAKDAVTPDPK